MKNCSRKNKKTSVPAEPSGATSATSAHDNTTNNVGAVMNEIQERKNRENNLIIYGIEEKDTTSREERVEHDLVQTVEILKICDTHIQTKEVKKTIRLGKYDKEKKDKKRPILVTLEDSEKKSKIFKGAKNLKEIEKWENISLANDLTKSERESEKALHEKAKEI